MQEYGLFSDDSEDYSSEQAVEAGFYSRADAEAALAKYSPEDGLEVHECEKHECEEPVDVEELDSEDYPAFDANWLFS